MDTQSQGNQESNPRLLFNRNRGIRVLSLFDGIATGLVALNNLEIPIDEYYYSEVEDNAIRVAKMHFGHKTHLLGDIKYLDERKLKFIVPIDLVIGGSPCSDLSRVNPYRRGLFDPEGTGCLFFHFCRIIEKLKAMNNGKEFFWLFENVKNMDPTSLKDISEHLGTNPIMLDAKKFTAMKRARLFWGNIPNMDLLETSPRKCSLTLQNYLVKNLNRKSEYDYFPSVTTQKNSLMINGKHPVTMDGKPSIIYITELERLFGLPPNYTDLGDLSYQERLSLLGKSWCVPVIEEILRPLGSFFKKSEKFLPCE